MPNGASHLVLVGALLFSAKSFADELRFHPERPRLGDLVFVSLEMEPLEARTGTITAFDHRFSLSPAGSKHWRGVLAVPVDIEPGPRTVSAVIGERRFVTTLEVEGRSFRRSELRVQKKFTEKKQPPSLRARIERESQAWKAMLIAGPGAAGEWTAPARPAAGDETSEFGVQRVLNGTVESQHYGLDLDGKVGDPVVAIQSGRVVLADERFYSGGTIVLDHGYGLYSAYFHLSKIGRKRGARVEAGQGLGAVGRTGRVTGPHLHLALFVRAQSVETNDIRGLYVDPQRWLDGTWGVPPPG